MRLIVRYFWVSILAALASGFPVLVAFAVRDRNTDLVQTLLFVSLANFFAIGTAGWAVAWAARRFGIFSSKPVVLVGGVLAGLGWYAFGGLLSAVQEPSGSVGPLLWTSAGLTSGVVAGYLLTRFGFEDYVHEAQFHEERSGRRHRYRAFLSYSRKDERRGVKIWRKLDRYRTPKELVGTSGSFGPIPKKLYPIFRDREELASGLSVDERLETALDRSEQLVVLLSPHSARSQWVDFEIKKFIEARGIGSVFPVIIDGVPNSGDRETECMPPALRSVDVLAADLRYREDGDGVVQGDGEKIGFLKLVAGMLGIEFQQLQKREAVRETKRFATVISVVALSMSTAMLSIVLFLVAAQFFTWTQGVIDAHLNREIERLSEILRADGIEGIRTVLRYEEPTAEFCRAFVDEDGTLQFGFFPEPVARQLVRVDGDFSFSVRYVGVFEYGGSPFTRRVDGLLRRAPERGVIIVALCNYDPPYFYGTFRSLFDKRRVDTLVRVEGSGLPSQR